MEETDVWRREKCIEKENVCFEEEPDVWRREKCIEKENVCFEEALRESIKENENKAVDKSQDMCV